MAKNARKSIAASAVGPKGRPLTGIRVVLDIKSPGAAVGAPPLSFLGALGGLTPTQKQRVVSAARSGAGGVRLVLEYPLSETRDIDEAIRDLSTSMQEAVAHAEKFPTA